MKTCRSGLAAMLCGTAIGVTWVLPASATQARPAASADRATTGNSTHRFDIPAGPLATALNGWSRQSGQSIIFRSEDVTGKTTNGSKGRKVAIKALIDLLDGTGLTVTLEPGGAVAVVPAATSIAGEAGGATPDILVQARSSWTLNTGIKRSQDDSQPFIVMTGEEIRRSGAPNLESFLRDRLNVNSTPGTSEQTPPTSGLVLPTNRGISQVNLRGLGARDTLILVDGRRQPGVNIGDGNITQASITGIPIASIERIEVLASSASGIYGAGASGGVINIVLKRDYVGGEINTTYSNTTDFKMGQGQVDLTYGLPLEGGRTRLSLTGSWQKGLPLLYGDRQDLLRRKRAEYAANADNLSEGALGVPLGSTVNFQRSNRSMNLQLKPQYGGQILSAPFGSVPVGYRGIATDGITGLLAGIGQYNRDTPDTAQSPGLRAPMIYGSNQLTGSMTVRREFNTWLTGYVGVTASRSKSMTYYSRGPDYVDLPASAPNNPFTSQIRLTLPGIAQQVPVVAKQRQTSVTGGLIVKLPFEWQAAIDGSYATSFYQNDITPASVSGRTIESLANGEQDVLRDLRRFPLTIDYSDVPFGSARQPGRTSTFSPSLRIAGPLPITLPGGRPQITLNIEHTIDKIDAVLSSYFNEGIRRTDFTPSARQTTTSLYGEVVLPLVGEANNIPLLRQLELRFSARAERYRGDGADPVNCYEFSSPTLADPFGECPGRTDVINRSITRNSHVDPSVSFRWFPVRSLMLRGSYTTGYLPPNLAQLVPRPQQITLPFLTDRLRGGELIGQVTEFGPTVDAVLGGNPNVRPETSRTLSLGAVITPAILPGLRISADWTRIRKRDIYFDPTLLIGFGNLEAQQRNFDVLLAADPSRAQRGAASDGFPVGPIKALDLSIINLTGLSTEAVDFVVGYTRTLFGGTIDFNARATYVDSLSVEPFPGQASINYAGIVSREFATAGGNAALKWRGSGGVSWTRDELTIGWQSRFFDKYRLRLGAAPAGQGSPFVASQLYHDVNVNYRFPFQSTLKLGINNIFNKLPPLDADAYPLYYSSYADPRLRNFYIAVGKSF